MSLNGLEPHEGFPTFLTFIDFFSIVISFIFFKTLKINWRLSHKRYIYVVSLPKPDTQTPGVLIMGYMMHMNVPHTVHSHGFNCRRSFLYHIDIWNKAKTFSTFTTHFSFTESLSYWFSWGQIPEGFLHHISLISSEKDPVMPIPPAWSLQSHPQKPPSPFPGFWGLPTSSQIDWYGSRDTCII